MILEVKNLRVLIAGGGTGGHVYPGISIAKEIKGRYPTASVLFVGTDRGIESKIVPMEGFPLNKITVSGLKGVRGVDRIRGVLKIPKSLWESYKIIKGFRPHIVVGVGGYSSGPPVLMASLKGIPTLLQEQNALPGLTNRLLSYFAGRVATAFKESGAFFGRKAVFTGNPVRADFKQTPPKKAGNRFNLLIFGGSQGAHPVNNAMVEALEHLQSWLSEMTFVHQTGEADCAWVAEAYRRFEAIAEVRPFFEDMPVQFAQADLLLCRSGATTIAEITVAGKASILVPFPLAADNHQQKNAEALKQAGAAEIILQRDLTGETLAAKIEYLLTHREELRRMEHKSRALGRSDSTERIVDLVEDLLHV